MLGKLIRYEFRATWKWMTGIIAALAGFTILGVLGLFLLGLDAFTGIKQILGPFLITMYVILYVTAMIAPFFYMAFRYYKNIHRDEGYLMNTLPVTPGQNILAKLTAASLWTVLIHVLAIGNILLFFNVVMRTLPSETIHVDYDNFYQITGMRVSTIILEVMLCYLITIPHSFLTLYLSTAVGQLSVKGKAACSIAAYFGISTVEQILATVLILVGMFLWGGDMFLSGIYQSWDNITPELLGKQFPAWITILLVGTTVLMILLSVVYYIVTRRILSRRLNLE